jgi:hypothetical protein
VGLEGLWGAGYLFERRSDSLCQMKVVRHHVSMLRPQGPPDPGLLLEWRQARDGSWEGLVISLSQSSAHGPHDVVTIRWVPADRLSPIR